MTQIRVHNPVQTDFAMVPNILWEWPGLSFKAKGFMAYLISFRHGSCPPVAAMEAQTGLGRDARKAVMRELQEAGLARWVVQRDASARIVAKFLEVTTAPLLLATAERVQSNEPSHTPENPSDGKPVAQRLKIRRAATENPAILKRDKDERGARAEKPRASGRSASSRIETARPSSSAVGRASLDPSALSAFQRSRLQAGQSCLIDGQTVASGSPLFEAWRQVLRLNGLEKAVHHA